VAVDDVAWIAAQGHEVGRVELKVRLKVKRLNVVDLEGVSLAAGFALGSGLEVGSADLGPLRRPRHARGDKAWIGFAEEIQQAHFQTPATLTDACPIFHVPPTLM